MKTAATNITTRHYRGRLAPSPSGKMHLGHIQTFWIAQQRAISHNGTLVLRVEDIDLARCKPHFLLDIITDLNWAEIEWDLGPGCKPFNFLQ
jgi:glutamyl-tRNA synthetase